MIILRPPKMDGLAADPIGLPGMIRNLEVPLFAEPWQAYAFALAVRLSAEDHFTWTEWTAALARELRTVADRDETDDRSAYFLCWLSALEKLVVAKQLTDAAALQAQKIAWREAYLHTPHGQPVQLQTAACETAPKHDPATKRS